MVHPEYVNCTGKLHYTMKSADWDKRLADCEKRTPLHAAAFKGESQMAYVLLKHGARVNAKDCKWVTPLHRACAVNSEDTVEVLLKFEADVCARDRSVFSFVLKIFFGKVFLGYGKHLCI